MLCLSEEDILKMVFWEIKADNVIGDEGRRRMLKVGQVKLETPPKCLNSKGSHTEMSQLVTTNNVLWKS